jgi:hypothetical protein
MHVIGTPLLLPAAKAVMPWLQARAGKRQKKLRNSRERIFRLALQGGAKFAAIGHRVKFRAAVSCCEFLPPHN